MYVTRPLFYSVSPCAMKKGKCIAYQSIKGEKKVRNMLKRLKQTVLMFSEFSVV
jgi:hypothetical protein